MWSNNTKLEKYEKTVHTKLQDYQWARKGEISEVSDAQELNTWIKMKDLSTFKIQQYF